MLAFITWEVFADDVMRIAMAGVLGGIIGLERELNGHFAGLRTHMMVAIGCAAVLLANLPQAASWLLGFLLGVHLICAGGALGLLAWKLRRAGAEAAMEA